MFFQGRENVKDSQVLRLWWGRNIVALKISTNILIYTPVSYWTPSKQNSAP